MSYFRKKPVTIEVFKAGGPEAFLSDWYWSSTQSSSYHPWCQYFGHDFQNTLNKTSTLRARAVSLIQVTP